MAPAAPATQNRTTCPRRDVLVCIEDSSYQFVGFGKDNRFTILHYFMAIVNPKTKTETLSSFCFKNQMIKKFSSPKMRNRQFVFTPKIEYELVAERSEANQNPLTFPIWCASTVADLQDTSSIKLFKRSFQSQS